MKSIGEMGPPCLRPHSWLISRPGIPFKRILEDDEARAKLIQFLHLAS
jgi:hypothetical protein